MIEIPGEKLIINLDGDMSVSNLIDRETDISKPAEGSIGTVGLTAATLSTAHTRPKATSPGKRGRSGRRGR